MIALVLAALLQAAPVQPEVSLHFERTGLPMPAYTLTVREDGTGTFAATYSNGTSETVPLHVSVAGTAKLFGLVRLRHLSREVCASPAKHMADLGAKTLTYTAAEGSGSCTFNYSEDRGAAGADHMLEAMAATLEFGHRLRFEQRFDRLGLDATMQHLVDALRDGRAIEPMEIASTLRALAADQDILERVRTRAQQLLATLPQS